MQRRRGLIRKTKIPVQPGPFANNGRGLTHEGGTSKMLELSSLEKDTNACKSCMQFEPHAAACVSLVPRPIPSFQYHIPKCGKAWYVILCNGEG